MLSDRPLGVETGEPSAEDQPMRGQPTLRRLLAFACGIASLSGCGSGSSGPPPGTPLAEAPVSPIALPPEGILDFVDLPDQASEERWNDRLHFCVFENGSDDWIYVGVKYGTWASGEFDLQSGSRLAFTGRVDSLQYGGILLRMGDVLHGQPDHGSLRITRVAGMLK